MSLTASLQDDAALAAAARALGASAASALLVLALAAQPWRGRSHATQAWGPPLAVGAAAVLGFWLTRGRPAFPPTQAVHWVFYAAWAGAAWGALEGWWPRAAQPVRGLLSVLLPVALLEFQRAHHWARAEGLAWTGGLAALVFVAWSALAALERRPQAGATASFGLAFATALAAGAYLLSGGALLAQLAGALALGLGLCALLGLWKRAPGLGAAGVAPFVLLHFALLWVARYLNELSAPSFALLSLGPLLSPAAWPVLAPRPRLAAALALLGPTLPAALALYLEWSADQAAGAAY